MTIQTEQDSQAIAIEQVVIEGDLSRLTPQQRLSYYHKVCETLGLNPYTKPFAYLRLNNRLVLYALRDATDQLRAKRGISVTITSRETADDLYVVTAKAVDGKGRTDESIGAVPIGNLKGEARANALMKGETKAKRRVTLSIAGLGWLDETEIETIPDARVVTVDVATGELASPQETPAEAPGKPAEAPEEPELSQRPSPTKQARKWTPGELWGRIQKGPLQQWNDDIDAGAREGKKVTLALVQQWAKAKLDIDPMKLTVEQSIKVAAAVAQGQVQ